MNASSDGRRDYEYIFSNGKWTTAITAAGPSGCTDQVQGERSERQKTTRVQTLSMEDKADGNGRTLTHEDPALSPGWTTMHHAIFSQNLPPLSRSHETGALEKRRESDPPNSGILTQDESQSLDLSNESNTMDHIPEAKSKPDWISGTVFSPDTHWNDHIHEDFQQRFEEAVDDVRDEICSTKLEEEKKCNMGPEKGGAVGQADVFDVQLMSSTSAETSWKRDSIATAVKSSDCELSGILWDTVLVRPKINAVLRDMVPVQGSDPSNSLMDVDHVQNTDSEIRQILRDSVPIRSAGCEIKVVHHSDYDTIPVHQDEPKMGTFFGDAVRVLNSACELSDVLGDTVSGNQTNYEIKDILADAVPVCHSELILAEKFHRGESEIHRILDAHPSCDATFNLPSVDIRSKTGANLLENDATLMPQDLTVRAKTDAESACCVSEDVVMVDTTTNSSDAGQLMPSYRPTMSNQEGINSTSKADPVELWVDACPFLEGDGCNLDKWGRCPSSCPPLTCADNTKALLYPPMERWSSSDSWASALSDWIQSVSVAPEDFSSTKPLTNSQNQSSTAIQDEKPFSSSGVCRKLSDGAEMLKDEGKHVDAEASPRGLQGNAVIEDFQEDTTSRNVHRPSGEESDALTGGDSEEEGARNDGALRFSSYSSPQCVKDPTFHGESDHLTHEGTDSCVFSNTLTTPIAASQEDADSIMPLTPINIGTSFLHLKEEQDASRNLCLAGITDNFKPRISESGPSGIPPSSLPKSGDVSSEKRGLILPTGDRFVICQENRVAYVTLDLEDVLSFGKDSGYQANHKKDAEMPRKTHKMSSKNKDKSSQSQTKTQENVKPEPSAESPKGGEVTVIETIIITEKVMPRTHSKKKKKQAVAKPKESEPLLQVENGAKPKTGKPKAEAMANQNEETLQNEPEPTKETKKEPQGTCPPSTPDDDAIKRRRIGGERAGSVTVRTRPQLPAIFRQRKEEDVKQKVHAPAEAPRVLSEIEAAPVAEDPHSVSLWCRFSPIMADSSVTWTKEGKILSEEKKRVGDEARVSLSVLKASSKDLGLYRCSLTGSLGSTSTSDYHLTSEVLMELIIPDHDTPVERREVDGDVEDVSCAPLLFKDDILTDQYFGEQQRTSIVAEKSHFGEGMHRKAFRATVRVGMDPAFSSGHSCVLKVHNSIGYGTDSNDELVQRNYSLAVEECYVQNTAREYIKAYTDVAKSAESFGEVPEIIPIFLVHRPSNAIPYATLEEELIGDFVKYSVKDGKEINLMRRDSEAGQKCCAFQHWVYAQTEGNLLVTDMQGVGMKLTDVGIATCKKGYKGFKGNCSTSFIDQFKALHQCNRFCELLGLSSLQPKPKRTAPPKPKAPPSAKKKPFSVALKGKS